MVKLLLHNLHFVLCSVFSYENSCVSHEALVFEQPYMNIEDVQALGLWVLCYLIQNVFKFCSHFVYFCFTQKTSEELVIMKPWLTTRPNAAQNWNVTGGKSYLTRFGAWITSRNLPTGFLLLISTGLITKASGQNKYHEVIVFNKHCKNMKNGLRKWNLFTKWCKHIFKS